MIFLDGEVICFLALGEALVMLAKFYITNTSDTHDTNNLSLA